LKPRIRTESVCRNAGYAAFDCGHEDWEELNTRRKTAKERGRVRGAAVLTTLIAAVAMLFYASTAAASGNAGYTTFNPADGGCLQGSQNGINCNNYADKESVWLNGGPSTGAGLTDGDYYFAILVPGFQHDGFIDGHSGNLSDTTKSHDSHSNPSFLGAGGGDLSTNRTFTVSGGKITSYSGSHASCDSDTDGVTGPPDSCTSDGSTPRGQGLLMQAIPYDDTTNSGGVYILAICEVGATDPSDCKFDAFRINATNVPDVDDLIASKTATPSFTRDYDWGVLKARTSGSPINSVGSSVTVSYRVTATWSGPTDSGWEVDGDITVTNPNDDAASGVDVNDKLSTGGALPAGTQDTNATCDVELNGSAIPAGGVTIDPKSAVTFTYECTWATGTQPIKNNAGAYVAYTNNAHVTWSQEGAYSQTSGAADATAGVDFDDGSNGNPTVTHACTTVTDTFGATGTILGTVCQDGVTKSGVYSGSSPLSNFVGPTYDGSTKTWTFTYNRSVAVVRNTCTTYTNTATISADADTSNNSSSASVVVCGPANTGARTIGFWKTTNGQNLVRYYCNKNSYNLGTYLQNLGGGSGPFSNAPTSCADLKTYVFNILNGASATNMNVMLRAQMLGTALDVWFSGPGWTSNKNGAIKPPSQFLSHNNLGSFMMDTTAICPMVDNLSTGSATCKNNTPSTNAVTAGAVPTSPMAMQAILNFAATIDAATPPWDVGAYAGANVWYLNTTTNAQDRTKQEILKNIFDQFNNEDAFGSI
jgi:hypothetical protein